MYQAVYTGKLSGNGLFTKKCQSCFEEHYGFKKCLLTTSGTDALEMCAMLCDLQAGDEVIIPSYTFVSTALAFLREGAKVVFADSMQRNPNLDAETLEALITPRTRVIVPVHYAGIACDMDVIMDVAERYHLLVVEDAAQAIDSYYKGKPLGGIGHLAAFSFHETKNVTAGGEGGLLVVNDNRFIRRCEILWEKGTNRAEFFRGQVNKYGWCDMGSSFLPSEINAAFLWAQLEHLEEIQAKRKHIWNRYHDRLKTLEECDCFRMPDIPDYATNNAHMFYLVCRSLEERSGLIQVLKDNDIVAPFHYNALNAAAAVAVATEEGIDDEAILRALESFQGTGRRFDFLGEFPLEPVNGKSGTAMLVDDYGHHPTEVDATIKAARAGWPDKNLVMLFQPHRFTRTRDLYDDFANVLTQVDTLLMLEVYPAGEAPIPGADSRSLCRTIRGRGKIDPILVPDPAQVAEMLAPVLTGNDLILVQGAGNIGKIARSLAEIKLKPQTPEEEQHD